MARRSTVICSRDQAQRNNDSSFDGNEGSVTNPTKHIAFFERATIASKRDGDEILPIIYDDNYVTVFPGETAEIHGRIRRAGHPKWVKLDGFNTPALAVPIK